MAKSKKNFIFLTFIFSSAATIIAIVAFATESWISAEIKKNVAETDDLNSLVYYGLLSGTYKKNLLGERKYSIKLACIFTENVCAYSVEKKEEDRVKEIQNILKECSKNTKLNYENTVVNTHEFDYVSVEELDEDYLSNKQRRPAKIMTDYHNYYYNRSERDIRNETTNPKCDPTFLNAGLWITTLIFLAVAMGGGVLSAILSVINVSENPINPWLNIWGLYIWNGIAACLYIISMIMWGIQFNLYIDYNVGIMDTLTGKYINESVVLSYSYWIIFVSFILHVANIGLFALRQYLIDKEPQITEETMDHHDGMIFVY